MGKMAIRALGYVLLTVPPLAVLEGNAALAGSIVACAIFLLLATEEKPQ